MIVHIYAVVKYDIILLAYQESAGFTRGKSGLQQGKGQSNRLPPKGEGKCHRKQTADGLYATGKGEKVR